jgi:hypothetical protein
MFDGNHIVADFISNTKYQELPSEVQHQAKRCFLDIWFVQDLGIQTISIDSIVGSEGRYKSFTRHFLPMQEDLLERWKKVN